MAFLPPLLPSLNTYHDRREIGARVADGSTTTSINNAILHARLSGRPGPDCAGGRAKDKGKITAGGGFVLWLKGGGGKAVGKGCWPEMIGGCVAVVPLPCVDTRSSATCSGCWMPDDFSPHQGEEVVVTRLFFDHLICFVILNSVTTQSFREPR